MEEENSMSRLYWVFENWSKEECVEMKSWRQLGDIYIVLRGKSHVVLAAGLCFKHKSGAETCSQMPAICRF